MTRNSLHLFASLFSSLNTLLFNLIYKKIIMVFQHKTMLIKLLPFFISVKILLHEMPNFMTPHSYFIFLIAILNLTINKFVES